VKVFRARFSTFAGCFPRPNPHWIRNGSIFQKKQDFNIIVDFFFGSIQFPYLKKKFFKNRLIT